MSVQFGASTAINPAILRTPSKITKDDKKKVVAVGVLYSIGELFINLRMERDNLVGINSREYRIFNCTVYNRGSVVNNYVVFHLKTLFDKMQEERASFAINKEIGYVEVREIAELMEISFYKPELYSLSNNALTVIPAILEAENVKHIYDSPFCLAAIVEVLNEERESSGIKKSESYGRVQQSASKENKVSQRCVKKDTSCVIQ